MIQLYVKKKSQYGFVHGFKYGITTATIIILIWKHSLKPFLWQNKRKRSLISTLICAFFCSTVWNDFPGQGLDPKQLTEGMIWQYEREASQSLALQSSSEVIGGLLIFSNMISPALALTVSPAVAVVSSLINLHSSPICIWLCFLGLYHMMTRQSRLLSAFSARST